MDGHWRSLSVLGIEPHDQLLVNSGADVGHKENVDVPTYDLRGAVIDSACNALVLWVDCKPELRQVVEHLLP